MWSTNRICDEFFRSRREDMKVIKEAIKVGYIRHDKRQLVSMIKNQDLSVIDGTILHNKWPNN